MYRYATKSLFIILLLTVFLSPIVRAQVIVTNDISADVTWTSDTEYFLNGLVFVNEGATLTIEPGTVIKGYEQASITSGDGASALVIRRGAKINAVGTQYAPIVFTSEFDDVNDPEDMLDAQGNPDRQLWGGLILLGRASNNQPTLDTQIEGIPIEEDALFGGNDDWDNSGTLRYVSIRHAGFSISGVEGDEINGLTLGSVGRGTTIEYIEVYANFDDCYEFFGGTVRTRFMVGAFCGDDGFDYDQGFRGYGQFWFNIHGVDAAGRGGEHDGGDDGGDGATPYSTPVIANATYIGSGVGSAPAGGDNGDRTFAIRDNAGGQYWNSIFTEFPGTAMNIEDVANGSDSRERLEMGDLVFNNNLFFGYGQGNTFADIIEGDFADNTIAAANSISDPMLASVCRTHNTNCLDPRPADDGPAGSGADDVDDDWFWDVDYLGAFDPRGANWTDGWTALWKNGVNGTPGEVTVTDDISADETWTADNVYFLDGLVFVNEGATLTIEAGTVIKGLEQASITTGDGASALIIRRGAKIMAEGTQYAPIIFTSEFDDIYDPDDMLDAQGNPDRQLWGGVILLGRATNNQPTTDTQIEGIPIDENALFGGNDDDDNSGTMRYVSIRHAGFSISGVEGDEINGLTLGSVGSGTTIEYIEVYANFDDCYEFFGGTVNTRYMVGAMCGDDGFDYDQGFRGKGQFWFNIHGSDAAGRGGEHDGGDDGGDGATPYSTPLIANATYIGAGIGSAPAGGDNGDRTFAIRDNAGGQYWNSIFTEFPGTAMNIEDVANGPDSRERLEMGDLVFNNNYFFGYGAGNTFADIVEDTFADATIASTNSITDPMLASVCRTQGYCLDPRPVLDSATLTAAVDVDDDWFIDVDYVGAFGGEYWIKGWTALDAVGYLGRISKTEVEQISQEIPTDFTLEQNYPNPFNPTTTIEYKLEASTDVTLAVFDMLGRQVRSLVSGPQAAGTYRVQFDAQGLASGLYLYRLKAGDHVITKNMVLLK